MAQRRYSDADRDGALLALAAGERLKSVSARLKIPISTLRLWRETRQIQDSASKKKDLATMFVEVAEQAIGLLPARLKEAKPRELATIAGIAVDKAVLLRESANRDEYPEIAKLLDILEGDRPNGDL